MPKLCYDILLIKIIKKIDNFLRMSFTIYVVVLLKVNFTIKNFKYRNSFQLGKSLKLADMDKD